jgi:RimJ/RimL family protein N-acetyltransferase
VKQFLNPDLAFHAVLGEHDEFIGFCSYGIDGQVPGGNYTEDALDIGLGMKPELTGQGRGEDFFGAILKFAEKNMNPDTCRLTVAKFNERALTLYKNFGFRDYSEFEDLQSHVPYTILVRES